MFLNITFVGCINFNKNERKTKVDSYTIIQKEYYGMHYLKVYDKEKTFLFIYPVGRKEFKFEGGNGPMFDAHKIILETNKEIILISDYTQNSVCYLKKCITKRGDIVSIQNKDSVMLQKIDSFCIANYSFHSIDIKQFKNWYVPTK